MVTYYTTDTMQLDLLMVKMDEVGIAYTTVKVDSPSKVCLVVDGVPLDYERALKWVLERK